MAGNALLDFAGPQSMTRHIDHVIGSAQNKVIAIFVTHAPVEGAVDQLAGNAAPVGFDKTCVVLPHRLHATGRQRSFDSDHPFLVRTGEFFTSVFVQEFDVVAIHGHTRAAEFAGSFFDAIGNTEDGPAGFCLPVVVDDGLAQCTADPLCGRLVQRLTGQEQGTQAGQVIFAE